MGDGTQESQDISTLVGKARASTLLLMGDVGNLGNALIRRQGGQSVDIRWVERAQETLNSIRVCLVLINQLSRGEKK